MLLHELNFHITKVMNFQALIYYRAILWVTKSELVFYQDQTF